MIIGLGFGLDYAPLGGRGFNPGVSPYTLTANAASFLVTGNNANLIVTRMMPAAVGAFLIAGQDATLTYSGSGAAVTDDDWAAWVAAA